MQITAANVMEKSAAAQLSATDQKLMTTKEKNLRMKNFKLNLSEFCSLFWHHLVLHLTCLPACCNPFPLIHANFHIFLISQAANNMSGYYFLRKDVLQSSRGHFTKRREIWTW
jgi:hypothetical protein